jgi:hypothetical protein
MLMSNKIVAFLLFREKILHRLEHMHHRLLPDASFRENGAEKPMEKFVEIAKGSIRHKVSNLEWCLHGNRTGSEATPSALTMAHGNDLSYLELISYVEELCRAYSWSLVPSGVYGTGQMLAFISADEATFKKAVDWLIGPANRDLVVSSYTFEELERKQFRGAIFHRSTDLRGQGLWKHGRGSADSALVLNYASVENPGKLPPNCEVVCEASGYQIQPILRRWIRVRDEAALLHFIQNDLAVIVTAPGLDERFMWLALQDFGDVAEHVNQDTLHFGLKALETVSWVYIPMSDDGKREIYVNNDPAVTTSFTQCDEMTHAPYFTHQFFF